MAGKTKLSLKAAAFIARHIHKEAVGGKRPIKQAVAIAFSKARKAGFRVPAR